MRPCTGRVFLLASSMLAAAGVRRPTCESIKHHVLPVHRHIRGAAVLTESQLRFQIRTLASAGCVEYDFKLTKAPLTLSGLAVLHGSTGVIRVLRELGADLRPALRTAVVYPGGNGSVARNRFVAFLLSLGASPYTTTDRGKLLNETQEATLYMRYFFERAQTVDALMDRGVTQYRLERVARPPPDGVGMPYLPRLPEIFFQLVGQLPAARIVFDKVSSWAFHFASQPKPLVLMFSGPSGHGKTELAQALSASLTGSRDHFIKIPCKKIKVVELYNFMRDHNGKLGVVLLDEAEKASSDVRDWLLRIWDRGEWPDTQLTHGQSHAVRRRASVWLPDSEFGELASTFDCNRIVWILTTTAFNYYISKLASDNPLALPRANEQTTELEQMVDGILRKAAQTRFGDSFACRINGFVPFFPFLHGHDLREQELQVLIDNGLQAELEFLKNGVRNNQAFLHVEASQDVRGDFAEIAKEHFVAAEGVRSLQRCIQRYVSEPIVSKWVRGELGEEGGVFAMSVDKERSTTSFDVVRRFG